MTLKLYFHPLSSFCHKPLIALHEHNVAFEPVVVDLGSPEDRAAFAAVWPLLKFPAMRDEKRGQTVAESSAVVVYLDTFYRGASPLIPTDPDGAWQAHMWDQFCDNYLQVPMQKITGDNFRPEGGRDPVGCDQARTLILNAYDILETRLKGRQWMLGDAFTLADCAASPALFYADLVAPITAKTPGVSAYLDRLIARPSYARALKEAEPFFHMVPNPVKPTLNRAHHR